MPDSLQPADIESLRQQLLTQQAGLGSLLDSEQSDTQPVALDQQSVGRVSRIDAIQQQQMALANQQQAITLARRIDSALQRIDDGSYGDCLECGEAIAIARLQAQPFASLCIHCQSAAEER